MESDIVNVTCYGKTRRMERQSAIREFAIATSVCEGSEKERYSNILSDLIVGRKNCADERDFWGEIITY